jgi:hypothetical protein
MVTFVRKEELKMEMIPYISLRIKILGMGSDRKRFDALALKTKKRIVPVSISLQCSQPMSLKMPQLMARKANRKLCEGKNEISLHF